MTVSLPHRRSYVRRTGNRKSVLDVDSFVLLAEESMMLVPGSSQVNTNNAMARCIPFPTRQVTLNAVADDMEKSHPTFPKIWLRGRSDCRLIAILTAISLQDLRFYEQACRYTFQDMGHFLALKNWTM